MTNYNLGIAQMELARLRGYPAVASAAVTALRETLTVFSHPSLAYNRAKAERGLASAEALLVELRNA